MSRAVGSSSGTATRAAARDMDMKVCFFLILAFAGLLGGEAARRQDRQSSSRLGCPPIPKRDKLLCCAPNQEPGHCVPLEKCPALRRIVEVGHTPTEAEKQLFRDSYCGGAQQNVKVCCPVVSMDCCGEGDAYKVSGGVEAVPMEFPWMAVLMYQDRRGDLIKYCGGSLINNRYILTAAHCVVTPPNLVRLGEHDTDKDVDCFRDLQNNSREKCAPPVRDFGVERVIAHPDYDDNPRSGTYLQNDIALIRLNTSVAFTEAVQPICLPFGNSFQATLSRASFRLAGWGFTNSTRTAAHALQKLKIPNVDIEDCVARYDVVQSGLDKVPILGKSQLCAGGEKGKGSCQGDSGGPITYPGSVSTKPSRVRQVQYGIVSFGNNVCGVRVLPTVFTRVTNYLMWILRNLEPPEHDFRPQERGGKGSDSCY